MTTTFRNNMLRLAGLAFLASAVLVLVAPEPVSAATVYIDEDFESPAWDNGTVWWNWLAGDYIAKSAIGGIDGAGTRITMVPGRHTAAQLNYQFSRNSHADPESAWFSYWMRFERFPEDTGKLPGFMALYSDSARGGVKPSEAKPGWSARVLFGPGAGGTNVKLGYYLYWLNQTTFVGDKVWWSQEVPIGKWVCIEGYTSMNTPGVADGQLDAWINGTKVLERSDVLYRSASQASVNIRDFMFVVHYGGSPTPAQDTSVSFDNLVVSNQRAGCAVSPTTRFTDTATSSFVADIEWLADQGITRGCNPTANTRFCPNDVVTRGQMAAFLRRALGGLLSVPDPPAPPKDPPKVWGVDSDYIETSLSTMNANGHPVDIANLPYPLSKGDWVDTAASALSQWVPRKLTRVRDTGAVPYVTFFHPDLSGFNAGRYDSQFNGWVDTMTGWLQEDVGNRMIVASFPNPNNGGFPYGDDATGFKAAYRKVHDAMRGRGIDATQLIFAYQMADEIRTSRYSVGAVGSGFGLYSPGPSYIDIAAIWTLNTSLPLWQDWSGSYLQSVAEMSQQIGDDVPILWNVVASIPISGSETRAQWINELVTGISGSRNTIGFVYMDKLRGVDYRIGTDGTSDVALLDALDSMVLPHDGGDWLFNSLGAWKAATRTSSMSALFSDDNGSVFEADIAWFARSGITRGCGVRLFCPNNPVTRGQMAAFLHRALGDLIPAGGGVSNFTDTAGSSFVADIEWLAATGITRGCNPPANTLFCPNSPVTRGQMAAFLHRALADLLG